LITGNIPSLKEIRSAPETERTQSTNHLLAPCIQHRHTAHYLMFKSAILYLWRNKKGSSKKFYRIDSMIIPVSTLIYTYLEQTDKWVGWALHIGNVKPSTNSFSGKHKCNLIHTKNLCKWYTENKTNIFSALLSSNSIFQTHSASPHGLDKSSSSKSFIHQQMHYLLILENFKIHIKT
jgi:hypothetical protein